MEVYGNTFTDQGPVKLFDFKVFLRSRGGQCSVSLPCGAVGGKWCVSVAFPGHTHLLLIHC